MDTLRKAVITVAKGSQHPPLLSLEGILGPLLSAASIILELGSQLRLALYRSGYLRKQRLPLPVISIGNITWGGSGKTPMAAYLASQFMAAGVAPLVVTRGYAGGDEARMLMVRFAGTSAAVAVGADRVAAAREAIARRRRELCSSDLWSSSAMAAQGVVHQLMFERWMEGRTISGRGARTSGTPADKERSGSGASQPFGVVLLDDGMQNLRTARDVEVVMVNAVSLWGNGRLVPRGPLRERPSSALKRADIVVLHHANLVSHDWLAKIRNEVEGLCISNFRKPPLIVATEMTPVGFLKLRRGPGSRADEVVLQPMAARTGQDADPARALATDEDEEEEEELTAVKGAAVLCMSGIGEPESFPASVTKLGPLHVESLEFPDHHAFTQQDLFRASQILAKMEEQFAPSRAILVVTEKDYMRDRSAFRQLVHKWPVLVLVSHLKVESWQYEQGLMKAIFGKAAEAAIISTKP